MSRKKGALTTSEEMWEQIRTLYVYGRVDPKNNEQIYLSQQALANEFNIPASTIGSRAVKDKWREARDAARHMVMNKTRERVANHVINSLATLREQDLVILDGAISKYVEDLLGGKIELSTNEALRAMALRREIYTELYGEPGGISPDVEVNVGVALSLDFTGLTEAEQETVHNAISRVQIRNKRTQTSDVIDAAPVNIVP